MRRTMGASAARSARRQRARPGRRKMHALTIAFQPASVDAGTDDHDIVNDGETAFATNPVAISILDSTVGQHGSLI